MIKVAYASISENGTVNGKAGDSTGKEVKESAYYDFGQTKVIRFKNSLKGQLTAIIAKALVQNDNIGYSQRDRYSLARFWEKKLWKFTFANLKKLPKCNCDCSSFCSTVVNLVHGKEIIPREATTATLLSATNNYDSIFRTFGIANIKKLKKGDIVLAPGKHVVIVSKGGNL